MALTLQKVADIIDCEVVFSTARGFKVSDVAALLINLQPASDARSDSAWRMEIQLGEGASARSVKLELPPVIGASQPLDLPIFIANGRLVFYRNRLLMPERSPRNDAERDEIVLRAKKLVYGEESELVKLKAAVANLEAAIEYTKSRRLRDPIPEDVKLLVWAPDGGACVSCGSKEALHFDHIIPVAKGGSNVAANIQILCQACNLRKSDNIAST
jgi:hypothetical protein